jgi:putative endonuclease
MYYTYVLKSLNCDYYYKGHCENLDKRLKEHTLEKQPLLKAALLLKLYILRNLRQERKQLKEKSISKLPQEDDI